MASYRKLSTGWQYRISYKTSDGSFKEKTKSGFTTKGQARAAAIKAEKQLNKQLHNNSLLSSDVTFHEYFKNWYEIYKEPHISDITKNAYTATMNIIKAEFPSLPLTHLSMDQYQLFLNQYGKKRAIKTVYRRHKHMKACLLHAFHMGHIETDITYNIKISGQAGKSDNNKFLSQGEAKKLIQELLNGYDGSQTGRAMSLFALSTGCRIGEVMALTEDDINRKDMTVIIDKSWDYKQTDDFLPTKTNSSVRTIAIDKQTLAVVDKIILYHKKRALLTGYKNSRKLIFVGKDFFPISNTAANKALRKACIRAGIKEITFHSLRHTHASLLLLNKADIFFVSKRLGHKNSTITAEVYAHVLKEMEDKGNEDVGLLASNIYS